MEEEWRTYLKENAPQLYEQMRESLTHIWDWRYKAGLLRAAEIVEEYGDKIDPKNEYLHGKYEAASYLEIAIRAAIKEG